MGKNKKGFTLAELLIVVAIIAVLVAISIPVFTSQLEKSREATDLANVRSAYAQVMTAVISEDKTATYNGATIYRSGTGGGVYVARVKLRQAKNKWQMNAENLNVGGVANGTENWKSEPKANGVCTLKYENNAMTINWAGEDHINSISAQDFLTKDIFNEIFGDKKNYQYNVINSNEMYAGGGTAKMLEYLKKQGIDLSADYGATTWQMYIKEPGGASAEYLENPAIYWSTVELNESMVDKDDPQGLNGNNAYVPVIGYRDGKYDVYRAKVVIYNDNDDPKKYLSIMNSFANVTNEGGKATFQFDNYEDAKKVYDKLLDAFNKNGTVSGSDVSGL